MSHAGGAGSSLSFWGWPIFSLAESSFPHCRQKPLASVRVTVVVVPEHFSVGYLLGSVVWVFSVPSPPMLRKRK